MNLVLKCRNGARAVVPDSLRAASVTTSRKDIAAVLLLGMVVTLWSASAGGAFSPAALLTSEAIFLCFYVVGSLASASSLSAGISFELPLRLLVGYLLVNSALLGLAWISPLGMLVNFSVLAALTILLFLAAEKLDAYEPSQQSLWSVGLSVVAASLWCQDSLDPVHVEGGLTVFKPWVDGFYHAVHIRIFAESAGASTIEDFRMVGVPARLYHYGVYMMPAVIKQASGLHSYAVFSGVLAPVGVLFTGLGASAFFRSLFGRWSGLGAVGALLLLPDGAGQGMQNRFMSYHFLTQISPSATYGLALLAVAWLFVLHGCVQKSIKQVLAGWAVALLLVMYKLHYVVASSLLLLLVPAVFFSAKIGAKKRILWIGAAFSFYGVALLLGQKVPGVPLIRLDGSSLGEILFLVSTFADDGALRTFLDEHIGRSASLASNLGYGIPYITTAALGVFGPLFLGLVLLLRKRLRALYLAFPLLLLLNFLVMFFGLALDFESSTPDELSHRPVMIVYFFIVAWVGGALALVLSEAARWKRHVAPILLGLSLVLLVVPASLGKGIQLMPVMRNISPARLPTDLVKVAEFIRTHGDREDVIQDAEFDRFYAIAALSERRTFVSHTLTRMPYRAEMVAERSDAVNRLLDLRFGQLVRTTGRLMGIRWFIRYQGARANWPAEMRGNPTYRAGPFFVYDFK
jgi:hypothetical protein